MSLKFTLNSATVRRTTVDGEEYARISDLVKWFGDSSDMSDEALKPVFSKIIVAITGAQKSSTKKEQK